MGSPAPDLRVTSWLCRPARLTLHAFVSGRCADRPHLAAFGLLWLPRYTTIVTWRPSAVDCPKGLVISSLLHVGNLSVDATRDEIVSAFGQNEREVVRVDLVMSRKPGRSRGFAFVEMATPEQARCATDSLDGRDLRGRKMRVSTALPPKSQYGGFRRALGDTAVQRRDQ